MVRKKIVNYTSRERKKKKKLTRTKIQLTRISENKEVLHTKVKITDAPRVAVGNSRGRNLFIRLFPISVMTLVYRYLSFYIKETLEYVSPEAFAPVPGDTPKKAPEDLMYGKRVPCFLQRSTFSLFLRLIHRRHLSLLSSLTPDLISRLNVKYRARSIFHNSLTAGLAIFFACFAPW